MGYCTFDITSIEEEIPDYIFGCKETYPNINIDIHYLAENAFDDAEEGYTDEWLRIYEKLLSKLLEAFELFNKEKQELDATSNGCPLYLYDSNIRINIDKSKLAQEIYNQLLKYKKHG